MRERRKREAEELNLVVRLVEGVGVGVVFIGEMVVKTNSKNKKFGGGCEMGKDASEWKIHGNCSVSLMLFQYWTVLTQFLISSGLANYE